MTASRVVIGVPVYNGGRTLAAALDSLLAQTHPQLRIVISDNGSGDDTSAIGADYARRFPQVDYQRADANRGAIWNFNRVFALGRADADYFCWSAHDDLRAPDYIARCAAVLDARPDAALVHSQVVLERASGSGTPQVERTPLVADAPAPVDRFAATLDGRPWHLLAYGLMRVSALDRTQLYRNFVGADLGLISELALYGRLLHLAAPLFTYRLNEDASLEAYFQRLQQVLDPQRRFGKLQSYRLALARAHLSSLGRAPLSPVERLRAWTALATRFGLSRGTFDELVRIGVSLVGAERVERLRQRKRRFTRSGQP